MYAKGLKALVTVGVCLAISAGVALFASGQGDTVSRLDLFFIGSGGARVYTAAAPFTLNFGSNLSVSTSGNVVTVNATGSGGGNSVIGTSDLTAQTTSLSTVTLVSSTSSAGQYRINYYVDQRGVCSSGSTSVQLSFQWTDSSNSRAAQTIVLPLTSSQSPSASIQGVIPVYAVASTAITYTSAVSGSCTTGGPSSYDVHISVENI